MPQINQHEIDAKIDAILNRWPAVGLAVGVVRDGALGFSGHGTANTESAIPVTEDTVFRIGSITKTFTAVAVMQLWEQGRIELDAPANEYLRAYRLIPAKESWTPATTRQLLTHTAGVPEWLHPLRMINSGWFAETFPLEQRVPNLAEYYQGGLRLAAEPASVPARDPDRLIKWFIAVMVMGVGVNLLTSLVVVQKWAWLPPAVFVAALLLAVSSTGLLRRERYGTTRARAMALLALTGYLAVTVWGSVTGWPLSVMILALAYLWEAGVMLMWSTLRSRADLDHVAVGTACLLVGSAFLLLGVANPLDAWTLGTVQGLVMVAFLALGVGALLLGITVLLDGWTLLGSRSCCSGSRPCRAASRPCSTDGPWSGSRCCWARSRPCCSGSRSCWTDGHCLGSRSCWARSRPR